VGKNEAVTALKQSHGHVRNAIALAKQISGQ
jgi:NACalpha-BTF3-like transcription factor